MPPLCAPTPPDLLSSSTTGSPAAIMGQRQPMQTGGVAGNGDNERARMVASLVTALNDAAMAAGAGAEENIANDPIRRDLLAGQAYTSLCFDFPTVSTNALAALASVFRSSPSAIDPLTFPISDRFISGLRYLVSVEITNQSGPVIGSATTDFEQEHSGEEHRRNHILELFSRALLLAPAVRLAVAPKDGGASLQEFLATFALSSEDFDYLGEERPESDTESGSENLLVTTEVEADICDDDSDWESLETFTHSDAALSSEIRVMRNESVSSSWPVMISKIVKISESAPPEVISAKVWDEVQLTDHLLKALQSMRSLDKNEVNVGSAAMLYAELLSERLLCNWSTSSSEVSRVVSALTELGRASGEGQSKPSCARPTTCSMDWNSLVLDVMAQLCTKVGRRPLGKIFSTPSTARSQEALSMYTKEASIPSPAFVRNLWQSVYSNLQFLQEQLVLVSGKPVRYLQLEKVLWVLCYMLRYSPGNVDLPATLLEGGIFRITLQLFVKVGRDPTMDSLRHFLLLSMASSPAVANFAAQVPSFTATVSATELEGESSAGTYSVVLRLLLRTAYEQMHSSRVATGPQEDLFKSNEAEGFVANVFDWIVEGVANNSFHSQFFLKKIIWVHRLLSLLEEAVFGTSKSIFKLWRSGGPIDKNIGKLQAALGSLLVRLPEGASVPSPKSKAHEKDVEDSEDTTASPSAGGDVEDSSTRLPSQTLKGKMPTHSTSDVEVATIKGKLKELLPTMILHLKVLGGANKGCRESKID